ncbi:MAG: glycosyltransferase family 2 protein [Candidatus Blackburnbacteria bacterium]|nr:glycosyltransferase family 2 protein [Candidatus Blackburnbacteria bacterium]
MRLAKPPKLDVSDWQVPPYKINQFRPKRTEYCVCIPVINEGTRLKKQLDRMRPFSKDIDIIISDKGSSDGSTDPKFLRSKNVRALITLTGQGRQGSQLRAGSSFAIKDGYQGIIILDGNNKDGVEAIPSFIKKLEEGYDYIQGSRFARGGKHANTPMSRFLGIRFVASPLLSLAAGYWYTDVTNGFRGVSKKYILHPRLKPFRDEFVGYEFLMYLTVRAKRLGLKTLEIPVNRVYPRGMTPTKIVGIRNKLDMLLKLFKVVLGHFNPN